MIIHNNRDKKGQFNQVMILLLILASAIVILLFVTKFVSRSTMDEAISACRLSVMTQAATSWGIVSQSSPLDINCDKRYVNFYNTRAELGLSQENMNLININYGDHKAKKFTELNEFAVDQVVAEELRVCKFQFGDGKVKIFPNDKSGIFSNKKVCFVCSEINFKPGVGKQNFTNLVEYTKKTTFTDAGTSYFNYLTEQTVYNESTWQQGAYTEIDPTYKVRIDSSQAYAVIIRKFAPADVSTKMVVSAIPFIGSAIGSVMSTPKESIEVGIIQTRNLNQFCDLQAS
jgi:hypothetical protein